MRDAFADAAILLQPEFNLRYGSQYLRQILGQLQDNPLLATVAYNAGPNKVRQWLPTRAAMPADLWAETIPYRETRLYVQRVMEYAAIYNNRLQAPIMTLTARMKPVLPDRAAEAAGGLIEAGPAALSLRSIPATTDLIMTALPWNRL